jgi:hypothetical protein
MERIRRLLGVTAALWLAACAGDPASRAPGGEVVPLRFAWPAGLDLRVDERHQRTSNQGRWPAAIAASHRVRAEPTPAGWRLVASDFALARDAHQHLLDAGPSDARDDLLGAMLMPTLVVDATSRPTGIADVEALQAFWRAALGEAPPLDPAALRLRVVQEWQLLVNGWAGQDLVVGRFYEAETTAQIASFGAPIPARVRFRYRIGNREACGPADAAARCVRLEVDVKYLPDLTPERVAAIAAWLSPRSPVPEPSVRRFDFWIHAAIIAEPDTLVPHRATIEARSDVEIATPSRDDVLASSGSHVVVRVYTIE